MFVNPLAENICGTIGGQTSVQVNDARNLLCSVGTVLWSGQIIPQIIKTHRERTSVGLSPYLM